MVVNKVIRRSRDGLVDDLDPVTYRGPARTAGMGLTSDVRGRDDIGLAAFERIELIVAKLAGELGLREWVRSCGSAAQMRVGHAREGESEPGKQAFDGAPELLRMLKRARAVEGDALVRFDRQTFANVARQLAHATGLLRVGGSSRGRWPYPLTNAPQPLAV